MTSSLSPYEVIGITPVRCRNSTSPIADDSEQIFDSHVAIIINVHFNYHTAEGSNGILKAEILEIPANLMPCSFCV